MIDAPTARPVTVRPSRSRQDTRTTFPGCGGFFIGIVILPASVVDQFHIVDVSVLEAEDDAPVGHHASNRLYALAHDSLRGSFPAPRQ